MSISNTTAQATLDLGRKIVNVLSSEAGAAYNVPQTTVQHLTNGDTQLNNAIGQQQALASQTKAATVTKATQRANVASIISNIHATVLNDPTVTDTMLVTLGFSPRRSGARPSSFTPAMVTGLVAEPGLGGTVKLRWTRGANPKATMFVVEGSANGTEWTTIRTLTRVSLVAEGFAPGVTAFFRVTATNSKSSALPSQAVGIYLPSEPASLSAPTVSAAHLRLAA